MGLGLELEPGLEQGLGPQLELEPGPGLELILRKWKNQIHILFPPDSILSVHFILVSAGNTFKDYRVYKPLLPLK